MSIRLRLIISYIAMIFVPILTFILSLILMALFFIGDFVAIKNYYQVDLEKNSLREYWTERNLMNVEFKQTTIQNPHVYLDPIYLSRNESQLDRMKIGIAVRKDNEWLYRSPILDNGSFFDNQFLERIEDSKRRRPAFQEVISAHDGSLDKHYRVTMYDMYFDDQTEGTLFVFQDITPFNKLLQKFGPSFLIALMLALILPSGLLTYLVSRSILKPLRELQYATEQIKEGNLSFSLQTKRNDELGRLSKAFEEMRVQLKISIDLRLREEENRKELISNISHDLKTPITAIKGYVEGILDGVASNPDMINKYMTTIYSKSTDLDRLIDELFLYAKLDLNNMPFQFEPLALIPFIQDCVDDLSFDLENRGIVLEWDYSGASEEISINADREKLKRCIINIVENSKKFIDKTPGYIRIRVFASPHHVTLVIEDNGMGIDKLSLPYIFDRFYRADKARSTAAGGSGLGLAIAKQIIQAHGATIQAASELGVGTIMTITFPYAMNNRS
jgi:signal transduction histidine kinase